MKTLDARKIERDKNIVRSTNVRIGDKLNNCAIMLAQTEPIRFPSETITSVVLAVCGGFTPFAVWDRCRDQAEARRNEESDNRIVDYCVNGHYFRNLQDALDCFKEKKEAAAARAASTRTQTVSQQSAELNAFIARAKDAA